MKEFVDSLAYWLADFYLATTFLLVAALVVTFACRQPVKRLAVAKAAIVALALLAGLCALPGWSLVSLGRANAREAAKTVPIVSPQPVARVDEMPRSLEIETLPQAAPSLPQSVAAPVETRWEILPWSLVVVVGYLAGSAAIVVWLVAGAIAAARLVQRAEDFPDKLRGSWNAAAGVKHLLVSKEIDVPVALGVIRPCVLLPREWTNTRSSAELSTVLAHEAAHIRNCDLKWLAASRVLLILLWAQPLYWWLRRRMRLDQETLADAAAAEVAGRQVYAEQLVTWARDVVARPRPLLPASVGLWEGASQLRRRVSLLLDESFAVLPISTRYWSYGVGGLTLFAAVLLSLVSLGPEGKGRATSPLNTAGEIASTIQQSLVNYPKAVLGPGQLAIEGRCVDQDGNALRSADVALLYQNFAQSKYGLVNTQQVDGKGAFKFQGLQLPDPQEEGYVTYWLVAWSLGRASGVTNVIPNQPRQVTFTLPPGSTLSGKVIDEQGNAVEGALVRFDHLPFRPLEGINCARTDANGRFAVRDLAQLQPQDLVKNLGNGMRHVRNFAFAVEHAEFATASVPCDQIPGDVDVILKPAATIRGRVAYEEPNRPAAGVRVMLQDVHEQKQSLTDGPTTWAEATTDADGRYQLMNLRAGRYNVWAMAPDWTVVALDSIEVGEGETRTATDLTLVKGGFLAGRLIDADTGEGVSIDEGDGYVSVGVYGPSRPRSGAAIDGGRVNADGSFRFRLPAGQHYVYVSGIGPFTVDGDKSGARYVEVHDGETSETIFRVRRPSRDESASAESESHPSAIDRILEGASAEEAGEKTPSASSESSDANAELEKKLGITYDRQGGAVEGDEIVGVVLDEQGQPLADVLVDAWTWYPGNETRTDAQGHFRLKGFERDQEVEVEFSKAGYCPRLFVTMPVGRVNWKISLNSRTYLDGRVTGSDGKPVPGAKIRAWRGPFDATDVVIDQVWTDALADEAGNYRMYLEPAAYHVQVRVPEVGLFRNDNVVMKDGDQRRFDIPLVVGPRFEAKVIDSASDEPVPGIRLWHWMQPGIEGLSDKDGKLVIDNMLPGKFTFNVTAGGTKQPEVAGEYARWWSPQGTTEWDRRASPQPGVFQRNLDELSFDIQEGMQPVTIVLERCVTIRGAVVDPDGKPAAGATVTPAKTGSGNSLTGDTRYSVRTDQDGKFEMRLPASGDAKYNLVAHDGGHQEWRKWANGAGELLQTQPGQVLEGVTLQLTKPCVVRGKVLDANGKPVVGHEVKAQAADKRENRYYDPTTKTNERGEFELRFVRAGKQIIQAEPFWLVAEQGPASARSEVDADPERPVEGLVFLPAQSQRWTDALRATVDELREKATAADEESDADDESDGSKRDQTQHQSVGAGAVTRFVAGNPATPWDYEPNAVRLEVENAEGKPVAGVEATTYRVVQATGERERVGQVTASDEGGAIEFRDIVGADRADAFQEKLQQGQFPGYMRDVFYFVLKREGLATVILPASDYTIASRGLKRRVRMRPAAELTGRVTDKDGKPVAGATVAAGALGGIFVLTGANAVESDSDGRFRFADLAAFNREEALQHAIERGRDAFVANDDSSRDYPAVYDPAGEMTTADLVATHPDFAVTTVQGGDVPGKTNVVMRPAAAIEGRVVEFGTGKPATNVMVKAAGQVAEGNSQDLYQPADSATPLFSGSVHTVSTRTDADGRYRLTNLPAGNYEIWAQRASSDWNEIDWVSTVDRDLNAVPGPDALKPRDLVIGPGGTIHGKLVDAVTGKPIVIDDKNPRVRAMFHFIDGANRQQAQMQEVPMADNGSFTLRAFPSRARVFVDVRKGLRLTGGEESEYRSPDGFHRSGQVFDLAHRESIDADIPVMSTQQLDDVRESIRIGFELLQAKSDAKAIRVFTEALEISPDEPSALGGRAQAYERSGNFAGAIGDIERLVKLEPDNIAWCNNLAHLLATSPIESERNGTRAVELAKRAVAVARGLGPNAPYLVEALDTLAAAQAETSDFKAAAATQREAIEKAPESRRVEMRKRLELYEAKQPYRRPATQD